MTQMETYINLKNWLPTALFFLNIYSGLIFFQFRKKLDFQSASIVLTASSILTTIGYGVPILLENEILEVESYGSSPESILGYIAGLETICLWAGALLYAIGLLCLYKGVQRT